MSYIQLPYHLVDKNDEKVKLNIPNIYQITTTSQILHFLSCHI